MSQAEFKKRLKVLMNRPENQICSDCPERQPRWASLIVPPPGSPPGSLPIGAFCCLECSGSHRRLGVHISFVRSINLDSWKEKEVLAMENGGNKKVNAIFEARLGGSSRKPTTAADGPTRERFIRDKYERRKFYDPKAFETYVPDEAPAAEPTRRKKANATRHPSEAARLRAESRKGRARAPKAAPTPTPTPTEKEVDLLDFAAFDSAPAPVQAAAPVQQPPAAPVSPNLDLFANMTVNDGPTSPIQQRPTKTNDQILAMFNAPQQQQQQPTTVAMGTPNGGMMMAATTMPQQQQNPMIMNNNMMMMQGGTGFGNMQGFGGGMPQQQQQQGNTMFMQQQGNAMYMQQQGNKTLMVQKNNQGNVMMMQGQAPKTTNNNLLFGNPMMSQQTPKQPNDSMMQLMQQSNNSDGFGFPQEAMGSGPAMPQNGQFYNAYTGTEQQPQQQTLGTAPLSPTTPSQDPFAQFGTNVFR